MIENTDKAMEHLEKACEISEQNQYMQVWADACYVISSIYVDLEENQSVGLQYAEQAEKLYKEHSGENTIAVADTLRNKGMLYYDAEQWHEALQNFEAAEAIYESLDLATGATCISIGTTLVKLQEYDRAEEIFQKAQSIAIQKGEDYNAADAKIYLGWLYIRKEAFQEAIDIYQEALNYFESSGDSSYDLALVYNNLRYCYEKMEGGWKTAMPYAIKASRTIEQLNLTEEGIKEEQEKYKQNLRIFFKAWKPGSSDNEFESWYQKVVFEGEDWESNIK